MRIAFYAPMKPYDHPSPSGDRRMARLLMSALDVAGHQVETPSRLRTYDKDGDRHRQARLRTIGGRIAQRLIKRYRQRPVGRRPQVWFTYHLYHKAPDWLGPAVSQALSIPYVVAEASYAPKQKNGPWAEGFDAAARAIALADLVLCPNSSDKKCVSPIIGDPRRLISLTPFIDVSRYSLAMRKQSESRQQLAAKYNINSNEPWLLGVAMMRPGNKLASYQVLGKAMARLMDRPWRLLVAGYGSAHLDVEKALAALGDRVTFFGQMEPSELVAIYAASDLYVWPAVNEAYGMAFLEAQACALPVVAGNSGGVGDVVDDGNSGILVAVEDDAAFAAAVAAMIDDKTKRQTMGEISRNKVMKHHDIPAAARTLDNALNRLEIK